LGLVFEVIEDLLDHPRVFDTGNHLDRTGAFPAGLDIDVENTFEPLCPGHRRPPFGWRWRLIGYPSLMSPAPLWGRHPRPVLAVRRNHPMAAGQADSGLGHQAHQSYDKAQRLKDHIGGAVPVRRLSSLPAFSARS